MSTIQLTTPNGVIDAYVAQTGRAGSGRVYATADGAE